MNHTFETLDEKLKSLGVKRMYEERSEQDVHGLEAAYGLVLPQDYHAFLQKYGKVTFEKRMAYRSDKKLPFASGNDLVDVGIFYCLEAGAFSLEKAIDRYLGRMPKELIPIIECPGGDQLCLGVEGDVNGKVFFWDHEKEYMEYTSEDHLWWNVHEIADSFAQFIMNLQEVVETPVDTSGIVSVRMSDKFLARIQKFKEGSK